MRKANCPFCGEAAPDVFQVDMAAWAVVCKTCGAIGPTAESDKAALQRWNASSWKAPEDADLAG